MIKITDEIYLDLDNGVIAVDTPTARQAKAIALDFLADNGITNIYGLLNDNEENLYQMDIGKDVENVLLNHDSDGSIMAEITEPMKKQLVNKLLELLMY